MKEYNAIIDKIHANEAEAKNLDARADDLYRLAERRAAVSIPAAAEIRHNIPAEDIAAADDLYIKSANLRAENKILTENARAALAEYAAGIIREIMQKYSGKQYGEKTREKIRKEAHAAGIGFYFEGYSDKYMVKVYPMNADGYRAPGLDAEMIATDASGRTAYFISAGNTVADFDAVSFSHHYKKAENPAERRAEIERLYAAYCDAYKAARAAQDALNAVLPGKHFSDLSTPRRLDY